MEIQIDPKHRFINKKKINNIYIQMKKIYRKQDAHLIPKDFYILKNKIKFLINQRFLHKTNKN